MNMEQREDTGIYKVVVNQEGQYSIWREHREPPLGWQSVGKSGPKSECLSYIKEVWTDMRPLSLKNKMEELARNPSAREDKRKETIHSQTKAHTTLVQRLSEGDHPVEVGLRAPKTVEAFKECIDRGYVHVRFTDTKGGTELGVRLDHELSDFGQADFDHHTGRVRVVGGLTLDYVKVQCVAEIDLDTLSGTGHLVCKSE